MGRKEEILEKVRNIAAPLAAAEGMEVVDVEFAGTGGHTTLRLYIDRAGGVSLDDCTQISRALSAALDVEDPIEGSYELEVSSPGLDRPLRTAEHFRQFAGENVRVKTYGPLENAGSRKTFVGRLIGIEGNHVLVEVEGAVFRIPQNLIAKANIEPTFAGGLQESQVSAPRARLSIDGRYLLVNGRDDVRRALRDIRKADRADVSLATRIRPQRCSTTAGRSSLLTADDGLFARRAIPPRRRAGSARDGRRPQAGAYGGAGSARDGHGPQAGAFCEDDRLRVRRTSGEEEEYPSSWAVPGDDAARALEHFFLTGQRPSFIHWHDDKTQQG